MISDPDELLDALRQRGLAGAASADVDNPDLAASEFGAASLSSSAVQSKPTVHRPWYIALLLGVSGWIAGLFLLAFVGMLIQPDSAAAASTSGIFLIAASWGLFKVDREGEFVGQFALALSIAGQCLVVFALTEQSRGFAPIAAASFVLQVVLALIMPNSLHRMLSTFFATIAWALTVRFGLIGEPEFWRNTHEIPVSLASAISGWMLTWLPVMAIIWLAIQREADWMARGWQPIMRPVSIGLITALAFATIASQPFESVRWILGDGDGVSSRLSLWPLLSALGAMGAMAASFALGSRALIGASAVALLLHVFHFYYEMGTSLLIKSILLIAMGAVMLIVSRLIAKQERA